MSLSVNFEKRLGDFTLHARFDADDAPTAILGASGCGKSLTMRCIAGVAKPDRGRIVLDGETLFDSAKGIDLPPQARRVGLLFQNYALFPNMTVEQNVLCGLCAEKDRGKKRAACRAMLGRLGLAPLAAHYPHQLSGGQAQRTALARILVAQPRLLVMDEPFSALDSFLREGVEAEVAALLADFAGTSLLITHNRDEAFRLCRDLIVMDSGRVIRAGAMRAVFASPETVPAARLTGCKNIFACERRGEHTVYLPGFDAVLEVTAPVPEGCTFVGLRAHDFAPAAPGALNSLAVTPTGTSENPFDWNIRCRGKGDAGGELWWKISKAGLSQPAPALPEALTAPADKLMPLHEG